jgi:hypothetical protein
LSRWLTCVAVVALLGCGAESTLLTVEITADRSVPDGLDRLCCTAKVDKNEVTALGYDAVGEDLGGLSLSTLPATIVFEDAVDAHDEVLVTATGTLRGTPAGFGAGLWSLVDGEQREEGLRVNACGPRRVVPFGLDGPLVTLPAGLAGQRRAALVDLDADARAEIVQAPASVGFISLNPADNLDATGRFLATMPIGATRIAVGDLDHDCAPDLLFASDDAVFPPLVSAPGGVRPFGVRGEDPRVEWPDGAGGAVAIGDLDGSGAADVLVAGALEYRVLLANTPRGGAVVFGSSSTYVRPDGAADGVGSAVVLVDVTGDGALDAIVGHVGVAEPQHTVRVFEGRDEALVELPDALAVAEARDVSALAVGPLDGDDTPDVLVVFGGGGGPVAALYGHHESPGEARFGRAGTPVFPDGDGRDVALVDLDGDCDLDVVLAIADGPSLVFEHTGDGLVQSSIVLPPAAAVAAGPSSLGPDAALRSVVVLFDDEGGGAVYAAGVD